MRVCLSVCVLCLSVCRSGCQVTCVNEVFFRCLILVQLLVLLCFSIDTGANSGLRMNVNQQRI